MSASLGNKFGKKFGAKVEEISIDPSRRIQQRDDGSFQVLSEGNLIVADDLPTREAAEQAAGVSAHSLRITPQMRRVALREGFPLHAAGMPLPPGVLEDDDDRSRTPANRRD